MSDTLKSTSKQSNNGTYELSFVGQMEANGSELFKRTCRDHLQKGAQHLIVDLSQVTVISSSGIGALMVIQEDYQEKGGRIEYVSLSREVRAVVRLMDLESILNITETKTQVLPVD